MRFNLLVLDPKDGGRGFLGFAREKGRKYACGQPFSKSGRYYIWLLVS